MSSHKNKFSSNGDVSYVVEAIVDDKLIAGEKWYLVKWLGYTEDENSWEQKDDLHCPLLLSEYERKKAAKTVKYIGGRPIFGPDHRLPEPIRQFHPDTPHQDLWLKTLSQSRYNIRVTNTIDNAPPTKFLWLDECVISNAPPVDLNETVGCTCETDCDPSSPCGCLHTRAGLDPYDKNGCVRYSPFAAAIYECNVKCLCSVYCPNRVTQRIPNVVFDIFRTAEKGWGVRTTEPLLKGRFITRYVGEIISVEESNRRTNGNYMFNLDFTGKDFKFVIDAIKIGNICRFFNHSCDPNMATYSVFIDSDDLFRHELAFFTTRYVYPNEELTIDYFGYDREGVVEGGSYIKCQCNAKNCRGYLPLEK